MVGNDVVDLGDVDADASTFSPRWADRVLCANERDQLDASDEPHRLLWRFWAAKEAAYKCVRQLDAAAVFSPPQFAVMLDGATPSGGWRQGPSLASATSAACGSVAWRGRSLVLRVDEGAGFVHARVAESPGVLDASRRGVAALKPSQCGDPDALSRAVRRHLLRDAEARLRRRDLEVVRTGRVPRLVSSRGAESAGLSLSHHGRFVAWAWLPGPAPRPSNTPLAPSLAAGAFSNEVFA